jgi:hypothetical protein
MNPFDEKEMFQLANVGCLYNQILLNEQMDWLTYNTDLVERGNLVWENGHKYYIENADGTITPSKLKWIPNENGKYEKVKGWFPKGNEQMYMKKMVTLYPMGVIP